MTPSERPKEFLYSPTASHDPTEGHDTENKMAAGFALAFEGNGASDADHDPPE